MAPLLSTFAYIYLWAKTNIGNINPIPEMVSELVLLSFNQILVL